MKPLRTLIISGTSLAIVAAADPSILGALLNATIATAWSQQDRGRNDEDKEREERERDKERDGDKDREREDRDDDRGGGKDKEQEDRDSDRGGGNDREQEDRDSDRGGSNDKEQEDRDSDRGGSNDKEQEDRDSDRSGSKDKGPEDRDNDRGGGNDKEPEDRDSDRGGGDNNEDRGGGNQDSGDPGAGNDSPGGGNNDNSRADADFSDRSADPAERVAGDDRDRDTGELAGRFDLDDTETFDDDGFLARRGEIIAMSGDALLRRRAEALGLEVAQEEFLASLNTTMYRLSVPAASPIDGILARLRAQDPEGVFDRNHLYDRSASTGTSRSGAPTRALVETAKGISVGLIDTGVDALHPALAGTHVELNYFVDQSRTLPEAHGTAVVSLLVSPEYGMLPQAQLYVACVFYEDRRGGSLSEARDLVRALDWLMKRRVPVINMSLAGPPNEVLKAAIKRAVDAGHLIVAAVGNGGPASPPLYPAAYDGVIAVTAVDGGQHVYRRANRGTHVQLAAMGVDVLAAAPAGTTTYSGTSFASPYVAALAAMEYRSLDPQKAHAVKESLRDNAQDLGPPGRDEVYGFGLARPRTISTVAR
jgi:subtilisin family serine protease